MDVEEAVQLTLVSDEGSSFVIDFELFKRFSLFAKDNLDEMNTKGIF